MAKCPKCGSETESGSAFCQNCGHKLDSAGKVSKLYTASGNSEVNSKYEENKNIGLIVLGYLTILILLIAMFSGWNNVRVINSDRVILYPLLSLMLSFYVSVKLINTNEKTFIHGIIVAVISFIIFLIGAIV